MKRLLILVLAVFGMILANQSLSEGAAKDPETIGQDLGTTEGKPITNGFFFINGKYIDPPYVVTRKGNGIYINEYLVDQPCPWPIPAKQKPAIPAIEPKMPDTITAKSSMYDEDLLAYLGRKRAYHESRLHGKEFADIMVAAYAELPCVKEAKLGRDYNHVDITWNNGQVDHVRIVPFSRKTPKWTRESILERTDRGRANYEYRLSKGDYYFLGSEHGRMTGTADGARMVLSTLCPILKISKDAREIQQRMAQAGFTFFDEKASEAFFAHKANLVNLEQRVEELKETKP